MPRSARPQGITYFHIPALFGEPFSRHRHPEDIGRGMMFYYSPTFRKVCFGSANGFNPECVKPFNLHSFDSGKFRVSVVSDLAGRRKSSRTVPLRAMSPLTIVICGGMVEKASGNVPLRPKSRVIIPAQAGMTALIEICPCRRWRKQNPRTRRWQRPTHLQMLRKPLLRQPTLLSQWTPRTLIDLPAA
jgi:hypothetical protein